MRDNPAEAAARALDGARVRGHTVLGHVMHVSHRTAHAGVLALLEAHEPLLVLGLGVAVGREGLSVERQAHRRLGDRLDVDGERVALPKGPRVLRVGVDAARLALALDADVSDDAGDYVCNAWLYRVLRGAPQAAVGFLHLPPQGVGPERLLAGLDRYLEHP